MHVDFLRHGVTSSDGAYCGSTDVALTALGRAQMEAAAEGKSWDIVYTSPLRRCAAMAETIATRLGVDCRHDERLRELHFGSWEGRRADELMSTDGEALQRFWNDPLQFSPPGGESLRELEARVLAFWHDCIEDSPLNRILVVTHGGPIRVVLAHYHRRRLSMLLNVDVPHAGLFTLDRRIRLAPVHTDFPLPSE
jgi:alpha-ribazole phosphatase